MPQLFPKTSGINSGLSFPHEVSYLYKVVKKKNYLLHSWCPFAKLG